MIVLIFFVFFVLSGVVFAKGAFNSAREFPLDRFQKRWNQKAALEE